MNKLPDVEAEEDGYQILAYILIPVGLSVSAMAAIASVLLLTGACYKVSNCFQALQFLWTYVHTG